MKIARAVNIEALRQEAKRYLPAMLFDFIDGGAEDEQGIARNRAAFDTYRLLPRYLRDFSAASQSVTLFGRQYASPFGIAPTGSAAVFRPDADLLLARAAARADVPFVMSGASNGSIEACAQAASGRMWFQLYMTRHRAHDEDILRRLRDAGVDTLVVTVDSEARSRRERDLRNRFSFGSFSFKPSVAFEALRHPAWLYSYFSNGGMPTMENWMRYAPPGSGARDVMRYFHSGLPGMPRWEDVDRLRRLWQGRLVLKGILHPDDALRAAELGVDGIIVSNHGGRQLDRAPATIEVLPVIVAAAGERLTVMLDSGLRRGADMLVALALGARFTFVGRATLYGLAAGGQAGVERAIAILRDEVDANQRQLGCVDLRDLGPENLWKDGRITAASMPAVQPLFKEERK